MQLIGKKSLRLGVAAWAFLMLGSPLVKADYLSGFTGNTQFNGTKAVGFFPAGDTGVVSYAVFDRTTGGALDLSSTNLLSGTTALANSARYVYLYEVVNNLSRSPAIDALNVQNPDAYTTLGYLSGQVFKDVATRDGGALVQGTNTALGPNPTPNPGGASVVTVGQQVGGIAAGSGAINPDGETGIGSTLPGFASFTFASPITFGKNSSVVFLTSNYAPQMLPGLIHDGSFTVADIPTAVTPEPTSVAMLGFGLCGAGWLYRRRRQPLTPRLGALA